MSMQPLTRGTKPRDDGHGVHGDASCTLGLSQCFGSSKILGEYPTILGDIDALLWKLDALCQAEQASFWIVLIFRLQHLLCYYLRSNSAQMANSRPATCTESTTSLSQVSCSRVRQDTLVHLMGIFPFAIIFKAPHSSLKAPADMAQANRMVKNAVR